MPKSSHVGISRLVEPAEYCIFCTCVQTNGMRMKRKLKRTEAKERCKNGKRKHRLHSFIFEHVYSRAIRNENITSGMCVSWRANAFSDRRCTTCTTLAVLMSFGDRSSVSRCIYFDQSQSSTKINFVHLACLLLAPSIYSLKRIRCSCNFKLNDKFNNCLYAHSRC